MLLLKTLWRQIGQPKTALAEHAAISQSPMARGLSVVKTDVMSVGTRCVESGFKFKRMLTDYVGREKMYLQGGVFSITSQILVVDLLSSTSLCETCFRVDPEVCQSSLTRRPLLA